ncbi:hypothetical protein PPSIR1_21229 [Plesiocystis pacifica SIR-1]|uniref:Uncharacterized protein n=1 Tax=Plesiocystis pacifica SIR-1 TaxID=391625 RepID=A6G3I5_9BACT|nr:hypothetical protein [Plesiocystis pacifica]EDM79592.1 hypothetical protein PPSIR1_21229 [Plesiocystis pacifica SIR-1]
MLKHYRGLLSVDDVPGKYTLRAMEIAINNSLANRVRFHELRKASKA